MKPTMIIGAPGTGKTYQLVQSILDRQPKDFALVSFTRRAAAEAKQRLRQYYRENELNFVRTIHSFCFELMNMRSNQVFKHSDLLQFGNEHGYEFTFRNFSQEDGSYYGMTEDDVEYRNIMIREAKMEYADFFDSGMLRSYTKYKLEHGLVDFNDMIKEVIQDGKLVMPQFDLVCVDEIQDLTPLQMQFVYLLVHSSKEVIFAGDGNQMIFEWAGVDREAFMPLRFGCEVLELHHNYRLPYGISAKANDILYQNHAIMPTIPDDSVQYVPGLPVINPDESYLVLARNGYLIKPIMRELEEMDITWEWLQHNHKYSHRVKSNILASTIHGAKGAEADNVILITDVSPATYEQSDTDVERRVWYVGLTRPRKRLYILEPQTDMYYDLL